MVVGYREWVLIGDELLSPLARTPWDAGTVTAECVPACRNARGLWREASEHEGPAPDPGCVCGLYAVFEPMRYRGRERMTVARGAVVLWGRIELHHRGMRAEFARVTALALPRDRHAARLICRVADRLEVAAVPARDLRAVAEAYGSPVAPDLIPPPPERGGRLARPSAGRPTR
jgi:hypothetical protein